MRVTVTGATGLIGSALVARLKERGDEVTVLARDPDRARASLGVEAVEWQATAGPAPAAALAGRDAVVSLMGEKVDQRWTDEARRRIRESRVDGTDNLVAGLRAAEPRPRVLVSGSAVGYYGPRGDERVEESEPPGHDFLASVVVEWERAAQAAASLGLRVVTVRSGVVLSARGGALARMLLPFRLGVGGPIAGGRQYLPWIHLDDEVGILLAALDGERWGGPVNASAPEPVTSRDFGRTLGRVLRRPAVLPAPGLALRALFGEMSMVLTTGQRAVPARALEHGYRFRHPDLEGALRAELR